VPLLVGHAQAVVDDAIVADDQLVAQDRRHAELTHQGCAELLEGVAEDDHLGALAQPVEEVLRALHRTEAGDHVGDQAHRQPVLVEDREAVLHQHVVVGLVASGAAQLGDARALGDGDPDLGHQHPLEIEGDDGLLRGVGGVGLAHGGTLFPIGTRPGHRTSRRPARLPA
jgi:hypothetical protein